MDGAKQREEQLWLVPLRIRGRRGLSNDIHLNNRPGELEVCPASWRYLPEPEDTRTTDHGAADGQVSR